MLMGKGLHRERQGEQVRLLAVPTSPGLGADSSGTERAGLSRVAGSRRVRVAESRWLWSRSFTNQQQNNAAEPWSSTRFTSNCTPAGDQSTAPYRGPSACTGDATEGRQQKDTRAAARLSMGAARGEGETCGRRPPRESPQSLPSPQPYTLGFTHPGDRNVASLY